MKIILVLLLLCVSAIAQTPKPRPSTSQDQIAAELKEMNAKIAALAQAEAFRQQLKATETAVADRDVALAKLAAENDTNAQTISKLKLQVAELRSALTGRDESLAECDGKLIVKQRTIVSLIAENAAVHHKFVLRFGRAFKRFFQFRFDGR